MHAFRVGVCSCVCHCAGGRAWLCRGACLSVCSLYIVHSLFLVPPHAEQTAHCVRCLLRVNTTFSHRVALLYAEHVPQRAFPSPRLWQHAFSNWQAWEAGYCSVCLATKLLLDRGQVLVLFIQLKTNATKGLWRAQKEMPSCSKVNVVLRRFFTHPAGEDCVSLCSVRARSLPACSDCGAGLVAKI